MTHKFDTEIAKEVGVNAAILYDNIVFWCDKNKANNKHFYDGYYWTYNSVRAWTELFPYLGKKAIENALKKLEEAGYIKSGNYNKSPYDRTKWYCVLGKIDLPKRGNENIQKGKPIPDNKPDNKPYIIDDPLFDKLNKEAFNEWLEYKKYKSKNGITKSINFLSKYSFKEQQEIVNRSIMNEWKGLFPLESKEKKSSAKRKASKEFLI